MNPILKRELSVLLRPKRAMVASMAYLVLLCLCFVVGYALLPETANLFGRQYERSSAGQDMFVALVLGQMAIVCALAASLTADSFAVERERRTMNLLMTAPIRPSQIVAGKLVSSLAHVSLLIAASLPMVGICVLIGGVEPLIAVLVYLVQLVVGWGLGMLGLWASVRCRSSSVATWMAYAGLLLLLGGGPGLDMAGGGIRAAAMIVLAMLAIRVAMSSATTMYGVGGLGATLGALAAASLAVFAAYVTSGVTWILCWLNPVVGLWGLLAPEGSATMRAGIAVTLSAYTLLGLLLYADTARALEAEIQFEARLGPDDLVLSEK